MVAEDKLIHVHRSSVSSFASSSINLSDGTTLSCDAVVFATGWETNQTKLFPTSILPEIGFPYESSKQTPADAKHWDSLDRISKAQVQAACPLLINPPPEVIRYDNSHEEPASLTPFRLFRYNAPPNLSAKGDRSLTVLRCLINTSVPIYAEVSSLWGIAYLENLPFTPSTAAMLGDINEMEKNVSFIDAWGLLRFRDRAASYLNGSADFQSYTDLLVKDLGLRSDRKRFARERNRRFWGLGMRSWFEEWFFPYYGKDYWGLIEDYRKQWKLDGDLT